MRNNLKTIISLLFIILVVGYITLVITLDQDTNLEEVNTHENKTVDKEINNDTKDTISLLFSLPIDIKKTPYL
ncbi:hypothetical protein U6A24_03430 [Aquimarina gracilis]|uniref:Uncharacterized protein n=1 Tax=Aquimarina gracilis TaxID=874422 RepID=A0ABU5ZQZ7_9FLAO|nr:hypothetical protein [Aquimarina gracilis]MEB3344495.1 hypothetical protein [Aquimarina gracilis]